MLTYSFDNEKKFTYKQIARYFSYDPKSGVLTCIKDLSQRIKEGDIIGKGVVTPNTYIDVRFNGVVLRAHRISWMLYYGKWPSKEVDHKNRKKNDNRIKNLREASHVENMANRPARAVSGYKGVYRKNSGWICKIGDKGRMYNMGTYDTPEEAALVYNKHAYRLWGKFAVLNIVESQKSVNPLKNKRKLPTWYFDKIAA